MDKLMIHKVAKKMAMTLLGVFALTSLSCERDTFYVSDYKPGEPVNLILGFELPKKEQIAVTRTLSDKDEHYINDFYLLIFNEEGKRIFGKYYYLDELQGKVDYDGGAWKSVVNEETVVMNPDPNSTHGYVMAKAVNEKCYIFGFANIGNSNEENFTPTNTLEATAVKEVLKEGITSTRWKLDNIETLRELYEVQMDAMSSAKDNILVRDQPNLIYSGAWRLFGNSHPLDTHMATAGLVNIPDLGDDVYIKDKDGNPTGNIDLTKKGMVYLRCLTSHIVFNIDINTDVFTAFEPESYQVINLPQRVYLMDRRDDNDPDHVKRAEIDFKESTVMTNQMIHDGARFLFDFWMFENHKEARTASGTDLENSLTYAYKNGPWVDASNKSNPEYANQYLENLDEVTAIQNYYKNNFGNEIDEPKVANDETTTNDETIPVPPKLKTVYGYGSFGKVAPSNYGFPASCDTKEEVNQEALNQFRFAKRELQALRQTSYSAVWNRKGDYYPYDKYKGLDGDDSGYSPEEKEYLKMNYSSKKFVYADDKATYVIIKGRLRFKDINLVNYGAKFDDTYTDYLNSNTVNVKEGYADVAYTIHLGNLNESIDNFDCLRNTEYTYYVTINGINNIYTSVEANPEKGSETYRLRKQPASDGMLNLAMDKVFNADAHFCQFNMMLTKANLEGLYFEMYTPWSTITTEKVNDFMRKWRYKDGAGNYTETATEFMIRMKIGNGNAQKAYREQFADNPDFNWFKFTPCYDQNGMFIDETTIPDLDAVLDPINKVRPTVKYQRFDPPGSDTPNANLWNLFDFMMSVFQLKESELSDSQYADIAIDEYAHPEKIEKRFNLLLYGINKSEITDAERQNSANVFECKVGSTEYKRETNNALPFMLDVKEYTFNSPTAYTAIDNGINNFNNGVSGYECYKYFLDLTDNGNGTYSVKEDYVTFLKDHYPEFSSADIHPIHRMFYTVYLDEYYYYKPPYGVSGWVKPYWKHFANQTSRFINFGYGGEAMGYKYSPEKQSGIMVTQMTVVQPSIQTFYSTETINTNERYEVAIGLEHVNETHDPRWKDALNSIATSGMDSYNGWQFSWENQFKDGTPTDDYTMVDVKGLNTNPNHVKWSDYVGEVVYDSENGMQSNVIMKSSDNPLPTLSSRINTATDIDGDNPYLAGAVRMCMNRNRDENGNGVIDKSELKWFLPSSRQLELAGVGHYSLQDPLFDYNGIVAQFGQRIPYAPVGDFYGVTNLNGQNLWQFHFVASDYQTLTSEELVNSPNYNVNASYQSRPYEMRCMRNLGGEYDKDNHPGEFIVDENYSINEFPYNVVSSTPQSLLYKFNEHGDRVFEMTYYDTRSLRGLYYGGEPLPGHAMFSTTNLPYYRFKVAKDLYSIVISPAKSFKDIFADTKDASGVITKKGLHPCSEYAEEVGDVDKGSWRAPNHAELALMVAYLRQYNYSKVPREDKVLEQSPPLFFETNGKKTEIYSCTYWNFAGEWGRMHNVNYNGDEGWGIHTTNPSTWDNKPNTTYTSTSFSGTMYLRCVKDIRTDKENYKEYNSDSESYGNKHGSDSEGFTEE